MADGPRLTLARVLSSSRPGFLLSFFNEKKRGERKRQQSQTSDGNQTGNSLNSTTAFKSIHKSVKWKTPRSIVTRCIRYIFILLFAVSSSKSNPRRSRKKREKKVPIDIMNGTASLSYSNRTRGNLIRCLVIIYPLFFFSFLVFYPRVFLSFFIDYFLPSTIYPTRSLSRDE